MACKLKLLFQKKKKIQAERSSLYEEWKDRSQISQSPSQQLEEITLRTRRGGKQAEASHVPDKTPTQIAEGATCFPRC